MEHKIKFLFLSLILASLVLVGFGCKGLSTEERQAVSAVELEYWTVNDDVDVLRQMITQYTALRPFLKVTVKQMSADELYTRLVEELAEDRGPDIISVSSREIPKYQSKLEAMPSVVQDATMQVVKKTIGTETVVNTTQVALPTPSQVNSEYVQTVAKDVVLGGVVYGLPLSLDTMAVYYNRDLLDRAGVAEPPTTWDEFQEAVKKINRYNADGDVIQSGAALGVGDNVPGSDDLVYLLFKQSNVDFINRSGRAVFNNAARTTEGRTLSHNVLDFYTDFSNPTRDTYSWNESMDNALNKFSQGSLAFFFGYSYHNKQIQARAPQLNFEIMPMLQLDENNPVNVANYWVQSVVKKSGDKNEAWALINYLTRTNANKTYLDGTGRPTALRAFIASQKEDKDLEPFVDQVLVADNWYRGKNYAAAKNAVDDMLAEWLTLPEKESEINSYHNTVLDRAASKINQTL